MALTPSNMTQLGSTAPSFNLPDVQSGQTISLNELDITKGVLVMFICNHCPYVKHIQHELAKIGHDYLSKELVIVAINSNDVKNYPEDSPEKMKEFAAQNEFSFPYLYDETQEVAKAYGAACTPDFFLYDKNFKLVYRGQLDDSRPGSDIAVSGKDLRMAIDQLLQGKPVIHDQKPSVGCNIKWKRG